MVGEESEMSDTICLTCRKAVQPQGFHQGFETEEDSHNALRAHTAPLEAAGYFRLYHEVRGYYCAQRPGCETKGARIDYLLQPMARLKELGWASTIGIECKRSGEKSGKAICQAIDYTYAVFRAGDTYLYPEFIFLWPMRKPFGDLESVMVQNRIGTAEPSRSGMRFQMGGRSILTLDGSAVSVAKSSDVTAGRKVGSR